MTKTTTEKPYLHLSRAENGNLVIKTFSAPISDPNALVVVELTPSEAMGLAMDILNRVRVHVERGEQ